MKTYLTVHDVAQQLDVREETVRRWLRKGLLQGTPLGRAAGYRIEPAALEAFLRLRQTPSVLSLSPQTATTSTESPPDATNWQCLEAFTDGFFVLDTRWRFVFLNRAAARLLSKTGEDLLGRNFWFLFDFLQDTSFFHAFYTAVQTGQAQECDEATLVPGHWLHVRVHPLAEGVAISLIDITRRKQAELYQARQARIVQSSDTVIFSVTSSGMITTWNRGAELFYGYSAEEMLGQSIALIAPPELCAEQSQVLSRLRWDDHPDLFATLHRHKSGRTLPVSLHLSSVRETQNSLMAVIIVSYDLSRWKDIEARLLVHQEQRFQMVENSLRYGIWISDAQGRLEYASPSFLNLLEMSLSDCQRHGWYHRVQQDEVPSIQAHWRRCWERGALWTMVYHLLGYDGRYHMIISNGQPVSDSSGKIIRWVGVHLSADDNTHFHNALAN